MSNKPIFVATHPRACSTAFERVFMTRRDILRCAHEPFGDSFYYGPERLGKRYENDKAGREASGFANTTYKDVLNRLENDGRDGKRVFIKDMAYYLMPPDGVPASIAPSLANEEEKKHNGTNGAANGVNGAAMNGVNGTAQNGTAVPRNPSVIPLDILKQFHFTFLIRHPRRGIPSFWRCTVPPLDSVTGWTDFMPCEAGYKELRVFFDYLRAQGIVGPHRADEEGMPDVQGDIPITVIDADDLLDQPNAVVEAFCKATGIDYRDDMLKWGDDEENQKHVEDAFEKWNGWHNDAIRSKSLTPRKAGHKTPTVEAENEEWREKYGDEAAKTIRKTVEENIPDYEYLKSFALKF